MDGTIVAIGMSLPIVGQWNDAKYAAMPEDKVTNDCLLMFRLAYNNRGQTTVSRLPDI